MLTKYVAVAASLLINPAVAQESKPDYSDRQLNSWYKSLKQPGTTTSCCDISDCSPVESRMAEDHYEALIDDQWWPVPPDRIILKKENPTGSAVACWGRRYKASDGSPVFHCFVPPVET
jgi:hypothetical protein